MGLTGGNRSGHSRARESRQAVVDCAEIYMRNHLADRVSISRLCRMLGRSERGVRSAFYAVHGTSPTRWLLAERLLATRMALVADERRAVTVTEIATRYGFYELGRFSAAYRAAFGETPSETLRAAVRSQAAA